MHGDISLILDVYQDLLSPSIMTYRTPWELTRGIRPTLALDVPGSLAGFFGWCARIQLPNPFQVTQIILSFFYP